MHQPGIHCFRASCLQCHWYTGTCVIANTMFVALAPSKPIHVNHELESAEIAALLLSHTFKRPECSRQTLQWCACRLPPIERRWSAGMSKSAFMNRGYTFQCPAWTQCNLHQVLLTKVHPFSWTVLAVIVSKCLHNQALYQSLARFATSTTHIFHC